MICDKCGKSNISGLSECSYCGAEMPKVSGCGGFADILSYDPLSETNISVKNSGSLKPETEKKSEGISDLDMQKLIKKSDNIIKSTQKNSLFGLIAIGLSLLILLSSIIIGVITINSVNGYKKETMTELEETKKQITEYQAQVDTMLEKMDNTNDSDHKTNITIGYEVLIDAIFEKISDIKESI